MKRKICVILALVLFLYIAPANLDMTSDSLPRQIEPNTSKDFAVSADGDESSQSINSFSSTLADDTLFYPDGITASNTADAGAAVGSTSGNYLSTQEVDGSDYEVYDHSPPSLAIMYLNFTVVEILQDDIDISIYGYAYPDGFGATIELWNGTDWVTVDDMTVFAYQWANCSVSADYVISSLVMMRLYAENATENVGIDVNYAVLNYEYCTLADADHYAESFSDVSDWTVSTGNAVTTDGDVMSAHLPDDNAWDSYITNTPSISNVLGYYFEARWKNNISGYGALWYMYGYTEDSGGGTGYLLTDSNKEAQTTYTTSKWLINDDYALESIRFYAKNYGTGDRAIHFDYFRCSISTETGWQHDGSTTTGISSADGGTIASDGDLVTMTADGDGSTFLIVADTTATATAISCTYYPFFSMSITSGSGNWALEQYDGSAYATLQSSTSISAGTKRFNMRALDTYVEWWRITLTASSSLVFDFAKAYSIANYTYTGSGVSTDDYLYVSSGTLYCSATSITSIVLDHDPALSTATATYNVWNVTTGSGTPQFDHYVSAWIGYSSETRGELTSGTLTDIRLKFTASANIAAITFIEDATAPTILDKYSTPANPTPTDAVTVSVVASDTVFIYEVTINAVTYPVGFSDVDYTCTEEVSQTVYSYTFTTLTEGYYLFAITVNDGANTDIEYLPVSTSTIPLQISDIVLITATESLAQVSGHSNKDCSYSIYENDTLQGSGSVSEGWFSVAWTKDSTAGSYIELGIKFYVSPYTEWVNGSYSVSSADVLQVTNPLTTQSTSTIYLSGHVNLAATYTIYEDDVQTATGSLTAGSFSLSWTRQSSTTAGDVAYAVKFTDGTTTRWVNGTYSKALETAFKVSQWWLDLDLGGQAPMVEAFVLTTWGNATISAYDNGTLMATATEGDGGVFFYWWMAEQQGTHNIVLNITNGVTTYTKTRSYFIPDWAVSGLVARFDIWNMQNNYTALSLESNWGNCTWTVYLDSVAVATSSDDPAFASFQRSENTGTFNLTIVADGGAQTYTISSVYFTITEEGTTYVSGGFTEVNNNYNNTYHGDSYDNPQGIFIDQGTAAVVVIGAIPIALIAYLAGREFLRAQKMKTERKWIK